MNEQDKADLLQAVHDCYTAKHDPKHDIGARLVGAAALDPLFRRRFAAHLDKLKKDYPETYGE